MNDPELTAPSDFVPSSRHANLTERHEQLRKLFTAAVFAVLILAGSFDILLLRQVVFMRKDLEAIRPQINQLVENYQKIEEPQIKNFVSTLVGFGRTHPDFNPILVKYKITTAGPTVSAPVAVPMEPQKKK